MGRIEVTPVLTSAYFFSGTLATNYIRFDTNQTRVAFYTPLPQSIHIYTAAQLKALANVLLKHPQVWILTENGPNVSGFAIPRFLSGHAAAPAVW